MTEMLGRSSKALRQTYFMATWENTGEPYGRLSCKYNVPFTRSLPSIPSLKIGFCHKPLPREIEMIRSYIGRLQSQKAGVCLGKVRRIVDTINEMSEDRTDSSPRPVCGDSKRAISVDYRAVGMSVIVWLVLPIASDGGRASERGTCRGIASLFYNIAGV
jgi:hypothetical protein